MLNPDGEVYVGRERWTAHTPDRTTIQTGQTVKITQIESVTVIVESDSEG